MTIIFLGGFNQQEMQALHEYAVMSSHYHSSVVECSSHSTSFIVHSPSTFAHVTSYTSSVALPWGGGKYVVTTTHETQSTPQYVLISTPCTLSIFNPCTISISLTILQFLMNGVLKLGGFEVIYKGKLLIVGQDLK